MSGIIIEIKFFIVPLRFQVNIGVYMNNIFKTKISKIQFSTWISVVYLIASILWITFSDRLTELLISDLKILSVIQTVKGLGFVLVTAFLLYILTKRHLATLDKIQRIIQKREQQYQQVFEANPQPMWIYDPDSLAFIAVNEAAVEHYGYSRDEFLHMTLKEIRPQAEIPKMVNDVTLQTDQPRVWKHRIKDGSLIDVEIRARAIEIDEYALRLVLARDVTNIKAIEKRLQESEQMHRTLIDASPDAIIVYAGDIIRFINQAGVRIFNLTAEDIVNRSILEFLDMDKHSDLIQLMQQASDFQGIQYANEIRLHLKNGDVLDLEISSSPMIFKGEQAIQAIVRDISHRKQMERELKESEKRFRVVAESNIAGTYIIQNGVAQYVNPALLKMFGYEEWEVVGKLGPLDFVHPEDKDRMIEVTQARLANKESGNNYVFKGQHKSGTTLQVQVFGGTTIYNGQPALIGTMIDVTEQQIVEKSLRESEERFRVLSEANLAGIYIIQDNLVQYANPAILAMFGYAEDEVIGKLSPLDFVHPDDKARIIQSMQQRLTGETTQDRYIFKGIQKDGASVYIEVFGTATTYRGRDALIGTMIDTTERHKIEEALVRSEANIRAIFDNTLQAFVLFDRDRNVQIANRVAQQWTMDILGKPLESGDNVDDLFSLFDINVLNELFSKVFEGERIHLESQTTVGDQERSLELNFIPVHIGDEVTGLALSVLDISQRKQEEHIRQVLEKANASLTETLDLDIIFEKLLTYANELASFDSGSVLLMHDVDKLRIYKGHIDNTTDQFIGLTFDIHDFPELQDILLNQKSIVVDDISILPHWDKPVFAHFRSWLGIPLIAGGEVLGIYSVEKREPNYFTEKIVNLLELLATHAAVAIQNAQLYQQIETYAFGLETKVQERTEELQKEYKRRAGLASIELAINEQYELQTLLTRTVNIVRDVLEITIGCSIVLWDKENERFTISASNVLEQTSNSTARNVRMRGGATRWVIDHRKPVIVSNTAEDPFGVNRLIKEYGVKAYVGVPLILNDEVMGVLYALDKHPRAYQTDEIRVLEQFALRVAVAISRVQLYTSLQETNEQLTDLSKSLHTHNNRISAILNSSTDGIILFSLSHGIQQVNPAFEKIINCSADKCVNQPLINWIASEDHKIFESALETVIDFPLNGIELHMQSPDRSQFDAELSIARAKNINSDDIQLVCVVRDITERKQSELELQKRESWYRALAANLPDTSVILFDQDYQYLVVEGEDPVFDEEVHEGMKVHDFLLQANFEELLSPYEATMKGEYIRIERHKNDRIFDRQYVPIIDQEGNVSTGLLVIRDITVERHKERALRESEERLRILFENIPDGMLLIDPNGVIEDANPTLLDILGVSYEQIVNNNLFELLPLFDIDPLKAKNDFNRIVSGQPIVAEYEVKDIDGIGMIVEFVTHMITIHGQVRFLSMMRDITAKKQAEGAMATALEKERELNELKSRFVSMASHEFRTPLASILAVVETLDAYRHKLSDEQITKRFQKIKGHITFLTEIMEDILLLARMQERRQSFNPVWLSLNAVSQSVLEEFQIQAVPATRFRYIYDDQLSDVYLDRKLIRQIITNLVSNAIKYSPPEEQIIIQIKQEGEMIVFTVQDKGIGIPKADLNHLFEPFHRATNVHNISGTGLGLAITKDAVELQGGTISVESIVDSGTTFIVKLPLIQKEQ